MRFFIQFFITFVFVSLFSITAAAQNARFVASRVPADSVAFWRLDPSRFAANRGDPATKAQRQVLIAGLRAAVLSGVIKNERASRALEGLLAASEVGGRPHTLCLLDLDATRPASGEGMDVRTLRMVIEIESVGDHAALLRSLRAILLGDPSPDDAPGAQRELKLPGGARGVAFRRPEWSGWHEVAWASTDRAFIIGLGEGAIERWLKAQTPPPDGRGSGGEPPWGAHETFVENSRPHGEVFFEAYLGLDRVRQAFPEAFVDGRVRRMLEALDLGNARDVALHGRWIDVPPEETHGAGAPLIAADVTWSARSETPGIVHGLPISESRWLPKSVSMSPPQGSYLIVMRADWYGWIRKSLDMYVATSPGSKELRHRHAAASWLRRNDGRLRSFASKLAPWLVISDVPTPVTPIPGAATLFAELRRGVSVESIEGDLLELVGANRERIKVEDGVWWYGVDPGGVLRIPAWGFVGSRQNPIMVGGWGPPVVTENRKRLGDPRRQP